MAIVKNIITVLAIETSCDETAAAVYKTNTGILSNALFSQIELHKMYGGVVPEIASRSHLQKMGPIIQQALDVAGVTLADIDVVGVTVRPGLPGSLLVGLSYAKSIAWALNKKLIGINHLEGHAFSACIEFDVPFPHLCLTASGGHTALYNINGFGDYQVLGQTVDDAAGEAFDKIAKLVGLPYPGGPVIEKLAREANFQDFFKYPRSKLAGLNFSFSGLKTAVLYDLVDRGYYDLQQKKILPTLTDEVRMQIASSLLVCIKDIFIQKLSRAYQENRNVKAITFVGGVACNKYLKLELATWCEARNIKFFTPAGQYCTDNAAMIAFVTHYKAQQGLFDDLSLDIF